MQSALLCTALPPTCLTHLQRAVSSSQPREAAPSHMVGRITVFSHWENWWKVKAVERREYEEGCASPCPWAPSRHSLVLEWTVYCSQLTSRPK